MAITKRIDKGSSLTYQEMDDNIDAIAPRTSATGSVQIPAGTTAQRDGSPTNGYLRYNTQLNQFEGYINGGWGGLGGGGGSGDPNQNAFSNFAVSGQTTIAADQTTDTINFAAGANITLTTNATTDTLTIAANFSQDFAFSSLTGKPTTVAGYGITDAQALLVSGTNIKTINSQSILGSGDLAITAAADWASITNKPNTISGFGIIDAFDGAWSNLTGTPTTVAGYGITDAQDILVSGTNIKTINGASVLGSGDLTVTGSYGDTDVSAHLNTSGANTNEFLRWNGIDFEWASVSGGGGSETDPVVGAISGIVKADGAGNISAAVQGTDYSTFDGDWNSLSNVPTTLSGLGVTVSLLDLTNQSSTNIVDGSAGTFLTTDGNGNFSFAAVSGGGGSLAFTDLTDTPVNYNGAGNQLIGVNSGATGLTFYTQSAGAESNDLSQTVTWAIVPDAFISNTSVVQHQADLRITESQITDLGNYIEVETDPVFSASAVANVVADATGNGFLRNNGGEWYYDNNVYTTSTVAEVDPVFSAHTTSDIVQGTGLLGNGGSANTWYYDANTYIQGSDVPDNETDPVFSAHTTANINNGSGFLKQDGAGNWFYDANDYITAAGAETDPIFTAHTTYNIADGTGYLKNDGGGTWSYESNTFLTAEEDPVFDAHTVSDIVDGEGFLRQDNANNWYWDANTYITANDIPASTATLDDVVGNGNQTTNSAEFGGLTVDGNNVIVEGSNNALLTNGAAYITLTDLSAAGDLTYDDETGVFTANLQSTGIVLEDLSVDYNPAGVANLTYNDTTGAFTYTPPDLSTYLTSGDLPAETDPVFSAWTGSSITDGTGFLRNDGSGNWSYDANTFLDDAGVQLIINGHLNTGTAGNNQVLSWDAENEDFYWAAAGGGSGGIDFTDLSVTVNPASGGGNLTYDDLGTFTYTPPDFSSVTGNFTVGDNLNIQGSASDGGIIVLNAAQTGSPTPSNTNWSYLTVERGTQPNVHIRWNEGNDVWEFTNDGTNYSGLGGDTPTLDEILGASATSNESNDVLTLYRNTDGNIGTGTLRFESRDTTPNPNQSMGDITFYMDNDASISTSTLGEYARISAKGQQVTSGTPANNTGYIDFQTSTKDGLESLMKVGFDPFSASNNSSGAQIGTVMTNNAYVNGGFYVYEEVDTAGDLTSDANIAMYLTAYDSQTNTTQNRVEISHQNGVMRIIHRNRNNTSEFGQLTIPHSEPTPLRIYYADTATSYDIVSDQNFDTKFNTRMLDDDNLVRFNSYANTEVMSDRSDFGGFNGGASNNAEIVPGNEGYGAVAFFTFNDANNGTASQHSYIPEGHAEEVPHGMGILRDSSQHISGTPRWDPFGGPDFRMTLNSTARDASYFFGATTTFNQSHPTNLILTNSDYTPEDGTTIARILFRAGESTYTGYRDYGAIVCTAEDTTAGAYDGRASIYVTGSGSTGNDAQIGTTWQASQSKIMNRATLHYFGQFTGYQVHSSSTANIDQYIKMYAETGVDYQMIASSDKLQIRAGEDSGIGDFRFFGPSADYRFENDTSNNSSAPTLVIADVNTAQNANNDVIGTIDFQRGTASFALISAKNVSNDGTNFEGSLRFQVTSTTATPDYPDMILDGDTGLSINDGLGLTVDGVTTLKTTTEVTSALTGATGTVTHDLDNGAIFDHTSLAADFTANFTNVPTTVSRTIGVALILDQGATAYMPTAVQIDGAAQTILWQGGSAPSGTASGTDIVSFTLIRSSGGAWKVIGSATSYS
jgi:hypothetical protein